ncbi:MAG TPA: protein-L-isoaspartate O-methyltransferase [Stellaceae bacterium]|nr:protein-L-isoaspartate O-methyltransferase [Stellaceae bacterium]
MKVHETARLNMVDSQLRPNRVTDERVLAAFGRIRRELFVPEPLRGIAYIDEDLPLGGGRYLMEPLVAARLLQAAQLKRTEIALVVGAGSGYEAAVMAMLGKGVIALEEDLDLARRARAALVEHGIATVSVVEGPLRQGWRPRAPYDVILFGGAIAEVPDEIADQLAEGGRLLAVIRPEGGGIGVPARSPIAPGWGRALLLVRTGGAFGRRVLFDAATPLLPGFAPRPAFVF